MAQPISGVNELGTSTSPYLRQHADNPVAWRQWSDAAFAEARERDVPVFLSIGYSACHVPRDRQPPPGGDIRNDDQTLRIMINC